MRKGKSRKRPLPEEGPATVARSWRETIAWKARDRTGSGGCGRSGGDRIPRARPDSHNDDDRRHQGPGRRSAAPCARGSAGRVLSADARHPRPPFEGSHNRREPHGVAGLDRHRPLLRADRLGRLVVRPAPEGQRRLLPRRPERRLDRHRRLDLHLEHRLRAHRRAGRPGRHHGAGHGPLGAARVGPDHAGRPVRALLLQVRGGDDPGVPGEALQRPRAVDPLLRLPGGLRLHQGQRDRVRRGGGLPGAAAQHLRHRPRTPSGSGPSPR